MHSIVELTVCKMSLAILSSLKFWLILYTHNMYTSLIKKANRTEITFARIIYENCADNTNFMRPSLVEPVTVN